MAIRLLCALALLLLPGWAAALAIVVPARPDVAPIEIASQKIDTVVRGGIAETTIQMVFANPHGFPLEGTFLMPVPKDAQATRFAMEMDGKEVEAALLERDEARKIYTDIVRRMRDPGLMEWVDERTFRVQVFPIPPNGEMPVSVTLVQPVVRAVDWFEFTYPDVRRGSTVPVGKTSFSLRIEGDEPITGVWSPTHEIETVFESERRTAAVSVEGYKPGEGRALSICFAPAKAGMPITFSTYRPDKDKPGWFLLMAQPEPAETRDQSMGFAATFVFDISGSMNDGGKIDQAKKALVQCLGALRERDLFNIVTFATGVDEFSDKPLPATSENIARARAHVESLRAQGGTNISQALAAALAQDTGNHLHQIVFMTDGLPTVGDTQPSQILSTVTAKAERPTRIFAFGVGYDVNAHLLDAIATETRALSDYIAPGEEIETRVASFFQAITEPVATGVELDIEGVRASGIHPSPIPDIFAGRSLVVVGRFDGAGKGVVDIRANVHPDSTTQFMRRIDVEFPESTGETHRHVATLWAGRRLAFLIDESRKNGESAEIRDEAIALSKEYGIPTPWTSYLATDDSESNRRVPTAPVTVFAPIPELPGIVPLPAPGENRTIRLGVSQPAADAFSPAMSVAKSVSEQSGEGAVALSRHRNALDRAANSGQVARDARFDAAFRTVASRAFRNDDGATWREESVDPACPVENVQYLSDAWFALHEQMPEIRAILELGENVHFRQGNVCIAVGPAGRSTADEAKEIVRRARGG